MHAYVRGKLVTMRNLYCTVDVVGAYKSLLKEKEALEASLKALGANASRGCSPQPKGVGLQVQQKQSGDVAEVNDGESDQSPVNQVTCLCVSVCAYV